jgi:uncharacterized protein
MTLYLLATFYLAMVAAGLLVEVLFGALGLVPGERNAAVVETSVSWNYTTILNIAFLALSSVLAIRFLRSGGPAMLRMMDRAPEPREPHPLGALHQDSTGGREPMDTVYTCPMHPEVESSEPGRCPKCGMDLQPKDHK